MTARRLLWAALLAVAAPAAAGTGEASACSCADGDPRDRIEQGTPAVIGRVVSHTPADPIPQVRYSRYVLRVERALNVRLGREVVILDDEFSSCSFDWKVGRRVGAFLYRTRGRWSTSLCSLSTARELERATRPYPRPVGRGRVALLAGGSFGEARLMALDPRGRILGYGFGEGAVRRISVCPGGRVAAELLDRGRERTFVAVRSLESLRVLSAVQLPRHTSELACADAAGATVYAGGIRYGGRPARGRAEVHRVTGFAVTRVVSRPAEHLALAPGSAYVWSGGRLLAVALGDGGERTLLRMGMPVNVLPSPFGGLLAVQGLDGPLRLVDLATGSVVTRSVPSAWGFAWLGPDRLLARIGGRSVLLDSALREQRRYNGFRAYPHALLEDGLFGAQRYRLMRLDLATGRVRTAARLPDRGIYELAGVPAGPEVDLPRRAPGLRATTSRYSYSYSACPPAGPLFASVAKSRKSLSSAATRSGSPARLAYRATAGPNVALNSSR
jgi:hypothetical protein